MKTKVRRLPSRKDWKKRPLRLQPEKDEELVRAAEREGVSVNAYVVMAISRQLALERKRRARRLAPA